MDSIPAPRTMSRTMIEAFAIGFASTAGMLALCAIIQNRHKIAHEVKLEYALLKDYRSHAVQKAR